MSMMLVTNYQPWWDTSTSRGFFWITYHNGDRVRTVDVNGEAFRIILDILRNEKPVYVDPATAAVTTYAEPAGEEESPPQP